VGLTRRTRLTALRAKATVGHAARTPWRSALKRRGVDVTAVTSGKSCVVIAPHPDDETLGCGITILRRRAVDSIVTIVIATDGALSPIPVPTSERAHRRRHEALRACAVLGVDADRVVFLDFPDGGLMANVGELARLLNRIVREQAPDQILVPVSCDGHEDHNAANQAVRHLVEDGQTQAEVLEYPIWLWGHWPWTGGAMPSLLSPRRLFLYPFERFREVRPLLVDATGYRSKQRAALGEYASQMKDGLNGQALLPSWLLKALSGRYELFFSYGSLRHLNARVD
jgi:LmbE family N-acetylglucosaminyl deacetylase